MNNNHRKTLKAVYKKPTRSNLKYKNYIAHIQFDESADEFFGNVINTNHQEICFGGKTVAELKRHMEMAIDGHIKNCQKLESCSETARPFDRSF